ncbi:MAG: LacI family DNA-binding transcriptional regulator [Opitutus sp.]|nr:LacI family DNA-binding transcriptional regulator [Opitutus sp.]MCS6248391.1 LacI family DNA-binding transcriptional regulator [Opitutus sp.]MCS6275162.1 LacI family DNA-binding transcriptional regulator [Opitutus sp.]MCS6277077.1 LacI family DNA-binding transcriptional regulator [Opitutus sp.]MCS6300199.1 LacI family DNA-binding transcriptional regulator [Opitutus sp.]
MKATLISVSKEAGVSSMTVSRVIHNHPTVAKETRLRVLAVLQKQGYRRNPFHSAWNVSRRGDRVAYRAMIMFLCGEPEASLENRPWMAAIWQGVRERAKTLDLTAGYFHVNPANPGWRRIGSILGARGVNGVVFGPLAAECAPIAMPLDNLAVAAADYCQPLTQVHRAAQHHYDEMQRVFSRLLAAGYTQPGMVGPSAPDARACQWMGAFIERQLWLPAKHQVPSLRLGGPGAEQEFRRWCREFRPDVVVTALGEVVRWREALPCSHPMPPDLFLLDLDGPLSMEWGTPSAPPTRSQNLTGLVYPGALIGAAAVNLMATQLRQYEQGLAAMPQTVRILSRFQEGNSCRLGKELGVEGRLRR